MATYVTGYKTQTAGTEITSICPPNGDKIPVLRGFSYTAAGTLHNLYVMKAIGMTTTASFTSSGDTTIELAKLDIGMSSAAEDEDIAANDWIAYQTRHGGLEARKVSSVSNNTVTVAATGDAVDDGAKVFGFYEAGRFSSVQLRCAASATTTLDNLHVQAGVPAQDGVEISVTGAGMPLLVVVDNATAAGVLEYCSFEWIDKGNDFYV